MAYDRDTLSTLVTLIPVVLVAGYLSMDFRALRRTGQLVGSATVALVIVACEAIGLFGLAVADPIPHWFVTVAFGGGSAAVTGLGIAIVFRIADAIRPRDDDAHQHDPGGGRDTNH